MNEVVYKSISFADLKAVGLELEVSEGEHISLTGAKYKGRRIDIKQIYKGLFSLGIKNNQYVEVLQHCLHATADGTRVEDYRIAGQERNDKSWLNSGYASSEAQMSSSRMKDMVGYASRLSGGGDR